MTTTLWWDPNDRATEAAVHALGGADRLKVVVGSFMPDRRIKLRLMTPGRSGAQVFLAYPVRVGAEEIRESTGVLKVCQTSEQIYDEVQRYEKYVLGVLQRGYPHLQRPSHIGTSSGLAAIFYERVGDCTLNTRLRELAVNHGGATARELIDRLFSILHPWYVSLRPETTTDLRGCYQFAEPPFDTLQRICSEMSAHPDMLPVPAKELCSSLRALWRPGAFECELFTTLAHGDLHPDNVLVSDDGSLNLIDFGATGHGHFLRDFATLEAHLILRTFAPAGSKADAPQVEYLRSVLPLYQSAAFGARTFGVEKASRCLAVQMVSAVRRHAWVRMQEQQQYLPQYAFAVLRHLIRICIREDTEFTEAQRAVAVQLIACTTDLLRIDDDRLRLATGATASLLAFNSPSGPAPICDAQVWKELAELMLLSERVDAAGILPDQLLGAVQHTWDGLSQLSRPPVAMRYVTLPKAQVLAGFASIGGHRTWQAWAAANTGYTNLGALLSGSMQKTPPHVSDDVSDNCVIRCSNLRTGESQRAFLLTRIGRSAGPEFQYALSVIADEQLDTWLSEIMITSPQLVSYDVLCEPSQQLASDTPVYVPLEISTFCQDYSLADNAGKVRPVSIIVLCNRGYNRVNALVRIRSRMTDRDDFGKLSLMSSLIHDEDLAAALGVDPTDVAHPRAALDSLWKAWLAKQPDQKKFLLPQQAFVQASQREVFRTTRLELEPDRYEFKGTHYIAHEGDGALLQFCVFRVELSDKEFEAAKDFNPVGVHDLTVDELYCGAWKLNRFLVNRREWLLENVF